MELKKRSNTIAIIGTVVIVCTLLILLLVKTGPFDFRDFLGYLGIIYSEVAFFAGMLAIDWLAESRGQIVLRAGGGVVVAAYSLLVLVLSIVYLLFQFLNIRLFCIAQILFFMIGFIALFLLISVSKQIKRAGDME